MAESTSLLNTNTGDNGHASGYWCYHCQKLVHVESTNNNPMEIICVDCSNGFVVQSIPAEPSRRPPPSSHDRSLTDESSLWTQFIENLRRARLDVIDDDGEENEEDWEDEDDYESEEDESVEADGEGEVRSENENGETREEQNDNVLRRQRRQRRELYMIRFREFAARIRNARGQVYDLGEEVNGSGDNLHLQNPSSRHGVHYFGNPDDYVDEAEYQIVLQNLAESDDGRKGPPPAAKEAMAKLPTVKITSKEEALLCAVCKDRVTEGETATKLPCGHGYHGDCIFPWLEASNTCPICRYELPTDDLEYEERKKRVSSTTSGSNTDE